MTSTFETFAKNLVDALKSVFFQKKDIKTSFGETTSDSKIPSEKLVATELDKKINKSQTTGLVKNDGTIDTNSYLTQHQDISGKADAADLATVATTGDYDDLIDKPNLANVATSGSYADLTNKPDLATVATSGSYADLSNKPDLSVYLTEHQDISGKANSSDLATVATTGSYEDLEDTPSLSTVATSGDYSDLSNKPDLSVYLTEHQNISGKEDKSNKVTSWSSTTTNDHYPSESLVKNSLDAKANIADIPVAISELTNDTGYITEHQSLSDIGGEVTVEKQQTAETGYSATYVIKQDGTQVGSKINIPKDFLVQDAGMSEVTTNDTPVTGYEVGDKYLWFKINTEDGTATDEYIYILVSDLIDVYSADNTTLELGNNNTFSVKDGGIGTTQLSAGVNTSLGYANAWNSSAAKTITSADIAQWNAAGTSNLTVADVDGEIESYLQAIITELNN